MFTEFTKEEYNKIKTSQPLVIAINIDKYKDTLQKSIMVLLTYINLL